MCGKVPARETVFVESISVTADVAYRYVATCLAKNLGDSSHVKRINDATAKRVAARLALRCEKLDYPLDSKYHFAICNFEFEVKNRSL